MLRYSRNVTKQLKLKKRLKNFVVRKLGHPDNDSHLKWLKSQTGVLHQVHLIKTLLLSLTMAQNIPVNSPRTGWKRKNGEYSNGWVKAQIWIPSRSCGVDLKRAVHARKPSNILKMKKFCVDEWGKLSLDRSGNWLQEASH